MVQKTSDFSKFMVVCLHGQGRVELVRSFFEQGGSNFCNLVQTSFMDWMTLLGYF